MGSFVQRQLDVTFRLATGTFNGKGDSDAVKLSGLRVSADINAPGGEELASATIRIYGMSKDLMDRLTVITWQALSATLSRNNVTLETNGVVIFTGDIFNAMADYNTAPDVPFVVSAQSGALGKNVYTNAESYPGAVPVATIAESIAKQLGATLENNGVNSTVTDMYLAYTPMEKMRKLAATASIDFYFIPPVLAICPRGKARFNAEGDSPLINFESGLIGWPMIDRWGVWFTTIYNPAIRHGGKIKLESAFPQANGEFYVQSLHHLLESEKPHGVWQTQVLATQEQFAIRR